MTFWKTLAVAVVSAVALTACAAQPNASPTRTSGQLKVVVAFYPLQFVAQRVGGDAVSVENLTAPGAEPHDLELTAQQIASLGQADLVIYEKGFQAAVDTAVAQASPKKVVDAASVWTLKPAVGYEAETPGALDPHAWLDPTNVATLADAVSKAITELSPANQTQTDANANALVGELGKLDAGFRTGLAKCDRRMFVTTHAAFAYLADRYNLTQIPISGLEPTVEPTPARITEVQKLVKQHGITTIFYETLVSDKVAKAIADDLKLRTDVLDPIEGITSASKASDYVGVMTANLAALKTANGCK